MRTVTGSVALLATTGALAACRGDDGSGGSALRAALASYRRGDRAAAQDQVSEAYVSHFEEVEAPLEATDPQLKERLEEAIGTDLRKAMATHARPAEVTAAVDEVVADLDRAQAALR